MHAPCHARLPAMHAPCRACPPPNHACPPAMHAPCHACPLWTEFLTDASENITLRQLLCGQLSGYHADTPITIKAEASSKADSRPN